MNAPVPLPEIEKLPGLIAPIMTWLLGVFRRTKPTEAGPTINLTLNIHVGRDLTIDTIDKAE